MARREQAANRRLLEGNFVLERAPSQVDRRRRLAQRLRLVIERCERAIDFRDGLLRFAQRVARLPPRSFLLLERGV